MVVISERWQRRWSRRIRAARTVAGTVGRGFYLSGVDPMNDRDHCVLDLPQVEGPLMELVDALGGPATDRRFRLNRQWLGLLRTVVPTPPSRRWIAWTVKRRIAGVPVPDAVHDAVVDTIHRTTRPPSGIRVAVVLPPLAKLVFRRFPDEGRLLVHLDGAPLLPTFATQARVTTIGLPDPTEVYSGITSAPERRGFLSERHPRPPLVRLLPTFPRTWLQPGVTQVASTSAALRSPLSRPRPVALTIDSARCWHRAPLSRTEVIRIETIVLVPLLPHRRRVAAALRTTGGVSTTDAGRPVLAWPEATRSAPSLAGCGRRVSWGCSRVGGCRSLLR
jgi:hypothetical protein